MRPATLDPAFAEALRSSLAAHVTATSHERRRSRFLMAGGAVVAIGLAGGGVAVAADLVSLPGGDIDTPLAVSQVVPQTGPATVALDDAPAGTTHVDLAITCQEPGTITFPDGASMTCTADDSTTAPSGSYTVPIAPGATDPTIEALPDLHWGLTTTFVSRQETNWATNANGDTYGVIKTDGSTPDLIAAYATNGQLGYVYARDLTAAQGGPFTSPEEALAWQEAHAGEAVPIPVYEEDGATVIGEFVIGGSG